jgi:hypothetical protein
VFTYFLQPRIASIGEIYSYVFTLFPSLTNLLFFLTDIFINKSPLKFPFLLSFIVYPSLIPLGIWTYYFTFLFWTPVPRQPEQNYFILLPSPMQLLQVVFIINMPWRIVWAPVPLQVLHFIGDVPCLHFVPLQL